MKIRLNLTRFRSSGRALAVVFLVSTALVGATWLAHTIRETPLRDLIRGPAATLGHPVYMGFPSQIGILLWAATAAICLFSAAVLRRRDQPVSIVGWLAYFSTTAVNAVRSRRLRD